MKAAQRSLWILLLAAGAAQAEGGCPYGQTPRQMGAVMGCVPGGNDPPLQQQQQPVGPRWETRWGAIAIDKAPTNAGLGVVTGMASKRRAEKAAMADCEAKGGAGCKVSLAYRNQCAVVVAGYYGSTQGYSISQGAPTVREAAEIGMRECESDGATGCTLYYSACSYAERVQ